MKAVLLLILGLGLAYIFKGLGDNDPSMQTVWYLVAGGFAVAGIASFIERIGKKKSEDAVLVVVAGKEEKGVMARIISVLIWGCVIGVVFAVVFGLIMGPDG